MDFGNTGGGFGRGSYESPDVKTLNQKAEQHFQAGKDFSLCSCASHTPHGGRDAKLRGSITKAELGVDYLE